MFELVGQMVAYAAVGFVILVLGFFMIDVLTPGKLGQLVMERNVNAAVLSTATLGSLGLVMWFAIYFTGHGWNELDDVAVFGVVAVALQAVAFLVIDALTPGSLREEIAQPTWHPATAISAAVQVATALIICASLT